MDRPSTPLPCRARRKASLAGFAQVQTLLVLVCLGLAACLLILWVRRQAMIRRCDTYVEDMRYFAEASRKAFERQGQAPAPSGSLPELPKGLEPYVLVARWTTGTPFGGNYHWLTPYPADAPPPMPKDSGAILGAIQVNGFPPRKPVVLSSGEYAYLQQRFAKNAVPGAKLALGFGGWPVCIVYATP